MPTLLVQVVGATKKLTLPKTQTPKNCFYKFEKFIARFFHVLEIPLWEQNLKFNIVAENRSHCSAKKEKKTWSDQEKEKPLSLWHRFLRCSQSATIDVVITCSIDIKCDKIAWCSHWLIKRDGILFSLKSQSTVQLACHSHFLAENLGEFGL